MLPSQYQTLKTVFMFEIWRTKAEIKAEIV